MGSTVCGIACIAVTFGNEYFLHISLDLVIFEAMVTFACWQFLTANIKACLV
jgi:hypothetical protein